MKSLFTCRQVKLSLLIITVTFSMCIFLQMIVIHNVPDIQYNSISLEAEDGESTIVKEWLEQRANQTNLSKLGRILFLGEEKPIINTDKKYQILVWKYGPAIERRLLKQYTNEKMDPFEHCSASNCDITYSDTAIKTADIVIFHLHRTKTPEELPPKRGKKDQIWAFLTDESPYHTFMGNSKVSKNGKTFTIADFNGLFNWSMSYRSESDIPVPYGRTVIKKNPINALINFNKRRDVLVAIMVSNCKTLNKRWEYVRDLQNHMKVDVYGNCGTLKCPGHFSKDCPLLDDYLFYLSFENSNCDEYITEKLWWNAYHKNSIPIVMGGSQKCYKQLLPPNSFINIEDFARPASLAEYLLRLNSTNEFLDFYKWKTNFEVLNEHGYFQSNSFHYCRICEALNYNDKKEKMYNQLETMWNYQNVCHPPWM